MSIPRILPILIAALVIVAFGYRLNSPKESVRGVHYDSAKLMSDMQRGVEECGVPKQMWSTDKLTNAGKTFAPLSKEDHDLFVSKFHPDALLLHFGGRVPVATAFVGRLADTDNPTLPGYPAFLFFFQRDTSTVCVYGLPFHNRTEFYEQLAQKYAQSR